MYCTKIFKSALTFFNKRMLPIGMKFVNLDKSKYSAILNMKTKHIKTLIFCGLNKVLKGHMAQVNTNLSLRLQTLNEKSNEQIHIWILSLYYDSGEKVRAT